jgi:hypothetical protein
VARGSAEIGQGVFILVAAHLGLTGSRHQQMGAILSARRYQDASRHGGDLNERAPHRLLAPFDPS